MPLTRFDVFYAFSEDQGQSWDTLELCDAPLNCVGAQPAVDFQDEAPDFTLRDYIGIDFNDDRVWTCFMGSTDQDPNLRKSVIWSSQILP